MYVDTGFVQNRHRSQHILRGFTQMYGSWSPCASWCISRSSRLILTTSQRNPLWFGIRYYIDILEKYLIYTANTTWNPMHWVSILPTPSPIMHRVPTGRFPRRGTTCHAPTRTPPPGMSRAHSIMSKERQGCGEILYKSALSRTQLMTI